MREYRTALQSSRADALARAKASFQAASAFLLAAAMVGCSGSLDEADVAGANLEVGEDQGTLEIRKGSGDDAAAGGETSALTLACAPLCQGSCTPIDLATGIYYTDDGPISFSLSLNDQYVLFGGGGSEASFAEVGRVPKGGGAKTILINNLLYVTYVVGSGADAYFVGYGGGLGSDLSKVKLDGTIVPLPIIGGYPSEVAVDANYIYWIGNSRYDIYAMPRSGGTPSVVVPHTPMTSQRRALFVNGDSLYYNEISSTISIMKAPKSGASAPTLYMTNSLVWSLVFDRTHVYYTPTNNGGVYRMPRSGGTPVQLATVATRVVVDNERVYWLDGSALRAMCKDGTGVQVLAATDGRYGLAVDSTGIYWAGDNKIRKIAK